MAEMARVQQFLRRFAGEWAYTFEGFGEHACQFTGIERARILGDTWLVSEFGGKMGPQDFAGMMTLGYDERTQQAVGTMVSNMNKFIWHYEGALSATGDALIMLTQGPGCQDSEKIMRFRDVFGMTEEGLRTMSSSFLKDDGSWEMMMKITYKCI